MEFLKIWRLELRRQRLNLCIAFPVILVFAGLAFGGIFPHAWKDNLAGIFMIVVPLGGLFLSLDVFTRDFQQGTSPFFFSLPIKPWKVYLAKYLFSAFLFLLILFLAYMLVILSNGAENLGGSIKRIYSSNISIGEIIVKIYPVLLSALILLYLYTSITVWCIALKGIGGIPVSFFMIPSAIILLFPSFVWFSYDNPLWLVQPFLVVQGTVLLLIFLCILIFAGIGGVFWCRGIGRGRPMWILALKAMGWIFAASVFSFVVFHGIRVAEYLVTLSEFEKTPGIEIPKGKIAVVRSIWEGKVPKSADEVLNTDLKTMVEIPVADYGKYCDKRLTFVQNANKYLNHEIVTKEFKKVIRLLDAYESIPSYVIPRVTWTTCLHFGMETTSILGIGVKQIARKFFAAECCNSNPTRFVQDKYFLHAGHELLESSYLHLPFEKDTIPFIDMMIAKMEKMPVIRKIPIKVLSLGTKKINGLGNIVEKKDQLQKGLRDVLPGIEKHGFARCCAAVAFMFRQDSPNGVFQKWMQGECLTPAINSMKAWMWSAGLREAFAKISREKGFLSVDSSKSVTGAPYFDFELSGEYTQTRLLKYLMLPRLKLRKYALEHGNLPEKLSDALSADDIFHKAGDRIYRLEYCVNPRFKKDYPADSFFCCFCDESGRRHPHLCLVLLEYNRWTKDYERVNWKECDLDEPEPPLPGEVKRTLKLDTLEVVFGGSREAVEKALSENGISDIEFHSLSLEEIYLAYSE